jgi:hypothetical protein
VDFLQGQPLEETKRRGEKQQANLSNKKKTMNRTEIFDNIKKTYQNWVFHHGQPLEETKKRGEKQQANL